MMAADIAAHPPGTADDLHGAFRNPAMCVTTARASCPTNSLVFRLRQRLVIALLVDVRKQHQCRPDDGWQVLARPKAGSSAAISCRRGELRFAIMVL
jgi:hypothetical protein